MQDLVLTLRDLPRLSPRRHGDSSRLSPRQWAGLGLCAAGAVALGSQLLRALAG